MEEAKEGNTLDPEKILASAINYLIQGQDLYEASILLLSNIDINVYKGDFGEKVVHIELKGNRAIYDIIYDKKNETVHTIIKEAFEAVLSHGYYIDSLSAIVDFPNFSEDWRKNLLEVVEGKRPLNQCIPIQEKPRHEWEGLFFRSPVEITIARALDKYEVLFLPNCMSRLGIPGNREKREADFLVCYKSKWGILEINGDAFHTNSAKDHERGRLFKLHGIRVFEPYEAKRCLKEPDMVVKEFLGLIVKNG